MLSCSQTALHGKICFAILAPYLIASDFFLVYEANWGGGMASSEIGLINKEKSLANEHGASVAKHILPLKVICENV